MRTLSNHLLLFAGVLLLGLWSAGCYTQLGSVQEDKGYAQETDEAYAEEDTVSTEDYEEARGRFYDDTYDYYYPTVTVGLGYPWYWRYNSWNYYNPYWYDPFWGWCGTYYPTYYGGWYHHGWYDGWYPGTYYGHGRSGYATGGSGAYGTTRTYDSTRTAGTVRGSGGSAYTPVSGRTNNGATPSSLPTGRVSTGRRGTEGQRAGATVDRRSSGSSSGGRGGTVRREAPRSSPRPDSGGRSSRSQERYSPPSPSWGGSSSSGGASDREEVA